MSCSNLIEHTVDCNGNALVKSVAVSANERRNLSKLVDLEVLGGHALGGLRLDDLEVDVVCFGNGSDRDGSRVAWVGVELPKGGHDNVCE